MQNHLSRTLITVPLLIIINPAIWARDTSLEQCQRYQDQAMRYQELRRQGGSGPQMDDWKDSMRKYEQLFRDGQCHKHRRKLQR